MDIPKKMIVVECCQKCPFEGECSSWKKLDAKTRMTLAIGNSIPQEFMLKDCPLDDFEQSQ